MYPKEGFAYVTPHLGQKNLFMPPRVVATQYSGTYLTLLAATGIFEGIFRMANVHYDRAERLCTPAIATLPRRERIEKEREVGANNLSAAVVRAGRVISSLDLEAA